MIIQSLAKDDPTPFKERVEGVEAIELSQLDSRVLRVSACCRHAFRWVISRESLLKNKYSDFRKEVRNHSISPG